MCILQIIGFPTSWAEFEKPSTVVKFFFKKKKGQKEESRKSENIFSLTFLIALKYFVGSAALSDGTGLTLSSPEPFAPVKDLQLEQPIVWDAVCLWLTAFETPS